MDVHDRLATVGGLHIFYRDWPGPSKDAPVLVALHGYTSHGHSFDEVAPALASAFRVVVPDARGHGQSGWAPDGDYRVERQCDDVARLLGALGTGSVSLLGASMGGRCAYNLAAARPDLVERLVVVDICPTVVSTGAERIARGAQGPDRFASLEDAIAAQRVLLSRAPPHALELRTVHNLLLTDDGTFTWRFDPVLRSGDGLPRPDDDAQWAMLGRIQAPTLLVHGAESDVLSDDLADRFVERVPRSWRVDVAGAGHSVVADQPARFLAGVLPFLLEGSAMTSPTVRDGA